MWKGKVRQVRKTSLLWEVLPRQKGKVSGTCLTIYCVGIGIPVDAQVSVRYEYSRTVVNTGLFAILFFWESFPRSKRDSGGGTFGRTARTMQN